MALRNFRHKKTREIKRSLKKSLGKDWESLLTAPNQKFTECVDSHRGKARVKDSQKMLKERARNYSRNVDVDELIQGNKENKMKVSLNFLNRDGKRRNKLDDL